MSIIVALFLTCLFLPTHAWNARTTFGFLPFPYHKVIEDDVEKGKLDETRVRPFPLIEDTKEIILGGTTMISMDLDGNQSAEKVEEKGRWLVESEEANSEGEDVGVMDYVQPHRKSPIHNQH